MLDVGKFATNPEVRKRLKENAGIGTEATRGTIIKNLRERGYLESKGKFIVSTPLARELIAMLPAPITDAATTALWEEKLDELRRGLVPIEGARRVRFQGRRQRHPHHRRGAGRCDQGCR
ncbi:DNA topoisomerase 3 (plasmid) [Xanthomonas arboricola pv. corylina]|nr:DNA topoisomerase 3 [Xanthomonas arboricola pv. corylina]CAE6868968.1 DNA topoisomerase 3 [Xanthomonas arboricola pv. corylina]